MLIHRNTLLCALLFPTFAMGQDQIGQILPKHIVGGEDAISGEFPFVAKIIYSGNQVGCTGTLIAPDKVLTAGQGLPFLSFQGIRGINTNIERNDLTGSLGWC